MYNQDLLGQAEEQVASHEEYRKSYIACLDWLGNTKHRLQRLADYSGDKRTLQERLHQLRVSARKFQTQQEVAYYAMITSVYFELHNFESHSVCVRWKQHLPVKIQIWRLKKL